MLDERREATVVACVVCRQRATLSEYLVRWPIDACEGAVQVGLMCPKCEDFTHSYFDHPRLDRFRRELNGAAAALRFTRTPKARKNYEKILTLPSCVICYEGDTYVKSFYMLGRIHEQQGNVAKAIEHYEKFLDLWKDADPGIVEVEDAKSRLAELQSP